MIRVEGDNELVMDGELDEVVTEFGDIVSQYLRFMYDTHPIIGRAAEKTIISSIILAGCKTLPPAIEENAEEMSKAMIPMVDQIYESLKLSREYIKRKWKIKG